MLKKLTSFLLVAMLLATLTPSVIFAAETTESIPFAFAIDTSAGGNASKVQSNGRLFARGGTYENLRQTYISFDLSGLESKILAASEINLVLYCTRYNGEEAQNFNVYLLPDGKAKYVNSELTYNIAVSNSMATGGELVASNSTKMSQYTYYTSGDMASYLKNALADSSDSKVAFRIDGADTAAQSFVVSGHSLSVKYDNAVVSDQSHVSKVANLLEWANLSSETTDSVTQNLTLPSKYYGADITWASNDITVTSDGTVTLAKGSAKTVTLTANFNYNGATDTKAFTFTVPAAPATVETKVYSERAHVRAKQTEVQGFGQYNIANIRATGLNNDNDWYAFYKFDLSGLEDKIEKATKATLTLKSSYATAAFTVSLLADKCDNWSSSTLMYNIANELGMLSNSSNSTNVQSGIILEAGIEYTTGDFVDSLRAAIADNPTNSFVTFRFYGDTSTLIQFRGSNNVTLNLEYYEEDLNTDSLFEVKKDTLAWDDVTTQAINNVTEDLTLPTKFYGFDLSWKSDNAAVDALTGKVTRSKTGDSTVNLTATVTNGTSTYDKTFIVTVPAAVKSSFVLDIADKVQTRGGENGDDVQGISWGNLNARKQSLNDSNDRYIYLSFNLSGYEEKIMKADSATFSINNQINGQTFEIALLPTTGYDWSGNNLSYNRSNALGMMDNAITIATGASAYGEEYTTADFTDALKTVLASNPASSVITIRIYGEVQEDTVILDDVTPKLNISYYDMDLDADAFFADLKDDFAWDDITTQDKDNVIADLNLPSKFYGYDVTWTSDDEAVSSSGEVEVSGEVNPVKLTATVSNGTNSFSKEFDIVVSSKLYGIDFSNAMGSGAKVYAAQDTAGVLVFAAYADSTLLSVAPVNVTLADGENLVNSLLNTNGATEVKLMLVSDMDTLTPLCTSKVK